MLDFVRPGDDPELTAIVDSVRRFSERFRERARGGHPPRFERGDFAEMGKLGLCGMSLPQNVGGSALGSLTTAAVISELARAELGPAIYLSVHLMVSRLLARWSSAQSVLERLAQGEALAAFCLTEAGAGSDAAALRTTAVKTGEEYLLNGEKIYITSGGEADYYLVFARTAPDGRNGISAFLVEKGSAGLEFGPPEKKMGCESAPICSVRFTNCAVPVSALVGRENEGYRIALSGLTGGRINIAAAACGLGAEAVALATSHLIERTQFGRPLAEFQGLQFMLADLVIKLRAAALLTRDAAEALDKGERGTAEASIAKCFATDAAMQITTDAVQLLGGAGYLAEYRVERLMRDAKMLQIVEGTNQIQRALIARAILDHPPQAR